MSVAHIAATDGSQQVFFLIIFQQATFLLEFLKFFFFPHSSSFCINACPKASGELGIKFTNVKLFKGHQSTCSCCQQLALHQGWRKAFGSVHGYHSEHPRIILQEHFATPH